jgi:peptidyl-prolyl cis-trans isomerase B (cyclophilin B)
MKRLIPLFALMLALASCSMFKSERIILLDKLPSGNNPLYEITVRQGEQEFGSMILETFPEVAPEHARNFDSLVAIKFYDGTAFHRVIPGFMIQGGDPNSKHMPEETWGVGDENQRKIPAEFNEIKHTKGILSAARSQNPNSATSQFFICVADAPHLDGKYTVYGQVLANIEVAFKVVSVPRSKSNDRPNDKVEMTITKLHDYKVELKQ